MRLKLSKLDFVHFYLSNFQRTYNYPQHCYSMIAPFLVLNATIKNNFNYRITTHTILSFPFLTSRTKFSILTEVLRISFKLECNYGGIPSFSLYPSRNDQHVSFTSHVSRTKLILRGGSCNSPSLIR